jgi:heme-degrading monooxygenase HmoA
MILREWRARATAEGARAYQAHAEAHVVPALRAVPGHLGHLMTLRPDGELVEIVVLTLWQDMAAIAAFAGPEPEIAVVEPQARAALAEVGERVRHAVVWSASPPLG